MLISSPLLLVRRVGLTRQRYSSHFSPSQRWTSSSSSANSQRLWLRSKAGAASVITGVSLAGVGAYVLWPTSLRSTSGSSSRPLSPFSFTSVPIESSEPNPIDPSTRLITLRIPPKLLPIDKSSLQSVHSIYIKDDDIQVERPYTPLYGIEQEGENAGRAIFWIKRYPSGEVGRWLHIKQPGETIEIRGPVATWDYVKDMESHQWDEIIMISGGTGITPFFQALQARFGNNVSKPGGEATNLLEKAHFTLLHGSPTPSTLPPPLIMSKLQQIADTNPDSFSLKVFVEKHDDGSSQTGSEASSAGGALSIGRITRGDIEDTLVSRGLLRRAKVESSWWSRPLSLIWNSSSPKGKREIEPVQHDKNVLFLVCGPEPMIEALAGPRPKTRADLERTGILGELGYRANNVRRL